MNYVALILIILGGFTVTCGDLYIQRWVNGEKYLYFIIGLIIYTVAGAMLAYSFKYKNIVVASVMYILINIITLMIINYYYFNQSLTTYQLIGVFFGLLCITFLELNS